MPERKSTAPVKLRARLYCGEEIAIGPGKVDLLAAIVTTGSISAAGRALGMSYRRTWMLVDAMNRCWQEPLVATATGGSRGGGARLTPLGEQVLEAYRALQHAIDEAARPHVAKLSLSLRETPLSAAPHTDQGAAQ